MCGEKKGDSDELAALTTLIFCIHVNFIIKKYIPKHRLPEAMKLQTRVVELNHCITTELGIPGMKYILNKMGLRLGGARLPLKPLTAVQKQRVDDLMATYQLPRSS